MSCLSMPEERADWTGDGVVFGEISEGKRLDGSGEERL